VKDKVILFDGWCNLCGRTIRFIQKHDRSHQFIFISIQTEKGIEILKSMQLRPEDTDSVIYFERGKPHIKSDAFYRIAAQIGGIFKFFLIFRVLPKLVSDWIYDVIAKNRYKWFGKNNTCIIEMHQSGT
jgi:predicted DCC family thiol-disulfide oxidoreductase YuxK